MVAVRLITGQRIRVPDCWDNCSTEIFQRIISQWDTDKEIKDRSMLKLFNLMIDMEISPDADDLDLEAAIWECTRFVYTESMDFTQLPIPKFINIGGKVIEIPKDLGRMKIGQNIHVRQELQAVRDPNAAMSIITAIYIQPLYDNSVFDYHRAKEIEKTILQIPITQIYPIGFFFVNAATKLWERISAGLKADDTEENSKRAIIAQLAEAERLDKFTSIVMIEQYANHFGLDPDFVWQKETDDIIVFLHLWKERAEYQERYRAIDKAMNKTE